jgi:hypothetical protein
MNSIPYDPNVTRLTAPYYGTAAGLQELLRHVDQLAAVPGVTWLFASDDFDKPASLRLRFKPRELSNALRKALTLRRGIMIDRLPVQLALTQAELAFIEHLIMNLLLEPREAFIDK